MTDSTNSKPANEDPRQEPDDGLLHEYTVRPVFSELTIHAYSREQAEEIAMEIIEGDAHTQLHNGYALECLETDYVGPSDEDEEVTAP